MRDGPYSSLILLVDHRGVGRAPGNILTESALSFLGFGIQPPESSWGLMLASGRQYITTAWWIVVIPGLAIFLTALSFNLFGV